MKIAQLVFVSSAVLLSFFLVINISYADGYEYGDIVIFNDTTKGAQAVIYNGSRSLRDLKGSYAACIPESNPINKEYAPVVLGNGFFAQEIALELLRRYNEKQNTEVEEEKK